MIQSVHIGVIDIARKPVISGAACRRTPEQISNLSCLAIVGPSPGSAQVQKANIESGRALMLAYAWWRLPTRAEVQATVSRHNLRASASPPLTSGLLSLAGSLGILPILDYYS